MSGLARTSGWLMMAKVRRRRFSQHLPWARLQDAALRSGGGRWSVRGGDWAAQDCRDVGLGGPTEIEAAGKLLVV